MDFLSASTEGIRNTTTVFDQTDLDRVRLPRYISSDGVLRVCLVPFGVTALLIYVLAFLCKGSAWSIMAEGS